MSTRRRKSRVTGIGGIFFKAEDPKALAGWYRRHLGIRIEGNVGVFTWRSAKDPRRKGHTVWALFPQATDYFGASRNAFMINYRVKDLDAILASLRRSGADVDPRIEESEYGRFGWVTDPEGNRIELWQPPRVYTPPEDENPME
jgi:predicted enzyme related to lactoylglutathione lyase